jgi:Sec-independent protein translocase protein TatA
MHFSELLLVLIVALVVFPPKKLPELAQTLARAFRYVQTIKSEIFSSLEPIGKHIKLEENKKKAEDAEKI